MILLLGGTSDAPPIARRLAEAGYRVLVSQATSTPVKMPPHPLLESRQGALSEEELAAILDQRAVRAVVDAAHPYAATIHVLARRTADARGVPYFRFERPPAIPPDAPGVLFADDHPSAARLAFSFGQGVLLTIGTRHLASYVDQWRQTGVPLFARVLDAPESLAECRRLGLGEDRILQGRGPFGIEENRRQIHTHAIGVLVTKDSGLAGGAAEKLAAARAEGSRVVCVRRPETPTEGAFSDIDALLAAVRKAF